MYPLPIVRVWNLLKYDIGLAHWAFDPGYLL